MNYLPAIQQTWAITQKMLVAAQNLDWDKLSCLQNERQQIISSLPSSLPALSLIERSLARNLIDKILAHDSLICDYAVPSRDQMGILITSFSKPSTR